jgi:hypothetical protein
VSELDLSGTETDPWLAPDLRTIYYASTLAGTKNIDTATR